MATAGVNFLQLPVTVAGSASFVAIAVSPSQAGQLGSNGATVIDKFTADLSIASLAKNGAFSLILAASTPVTIDLTSTATAASSSAGDTTFATVNEVIFNNTGSHDVIVSPGATNPFLGPLGGTSPTFTVPAGSQVRWKSPAGYPVTGGVKNLKFDSGASAAQIAVAVGGA